MRGAWFEAQAQEKSMSRLVAVGGSADLFFPLLGHLLDSFVLAVLCMWLHSICSTRILLLRSKGRGLRTHVKNFCAGCSGPTVQSKTARRHCETCVIHVYYEEIKTTWMLSVLRSLHGPLDPYLNGAHIIYESTLQLQCSIYTLLYC